MKKGEAAFEDWQSHQKAVDPAAKAATAEYETEVHFQKCYGVMAELFEMHNYLKSVIPRSGFTFLDLGCAPGGFSSYLLNDPRCYTGFGVTLPSTSGGFPMRLRNPNFLLQQGDLFELGMSDLIASDIHICICDAQYLRNNISWDEKYRGVRCRSKQHGVWALLLKQFWLGLSRLVTGGILIFRFGWRDPGPEDPATIWYKKMTLRLFSLLYDLFDEVNEVKSDYFNALQSSFYVCCSRFDAERFAERQVSKLLGANFNYLLSTRIEDSNDLDILPQVDPIRTEEVDKKISDMLERINRIRLVHEQSRRVHEKSEAQREDPRAAVVLRPPPPGTSEEELNSMFSVYGRVRRIQKSGDTEITVYFAQLDHARAAAGALRSSGAFGEAVRIMTREEDQSPHSNSSVTSKDSSGAKPESPARKAAPPGFQGNALAKAAAEAAASAGGDSEGGHKGGSQKGGGHKGRQARGDGGQGSGGYGKGSHNGAGKKGSNGYAAEAGSGKGRRKGAEDKGGGRGKEWAPKVPARSPAVVC